MVRINLVPLSVNKAWKGQRYKTDLYKIFERDCLFIIPIQKVEKKPLELIINYGFSSKGSDIDNPTKMVIDILSKKFGFNDNLIYKLIVTKSIVKKGAEYFEYSLKELEK
jgi:Holliday junction resolvase RusA-like endonuclease